MKDQTIFVINLDRLDQLNDEMISRFVERLNEEIEKRVSVNGRYPEPSETELTKFLDGFETEAIIKYCQRVGINFPIGEAIIERALTDIAEK